MNKNLDQGDEEKTSSIPHTESQATPELNTVLLCPHCEASFVEEWRARQEVEKMRSELQTSWIHGQALSEEVDRLRAITEGANKLGFEILAAIDDDERTVH